MPRRVPNQDPLTPARPNPVATRARKLPRKIRRINSKRLVSNPRLEGNQKDLRQIKKRWLVKRKKWTRRFLITKRRIRTNNRKIKSHHLVRAERVQPMIKVEPAENQRWLITRSKIRKVLRKAERAMFLPRTGNQTIVPNQALRARGTHLSAENLRVSRNDELFA